MYSVNSSAGRFRLIALLEGISYLFLLGIAMPVKYGLDFPYLVKFGGWAHGLLFVVFFFALADVVMTEKWKIKKTFLAAVSSVLPFGFYIFEKYWSKD